MQKFLLSTFGFISVLLVAAAVTVAVMSSTRQVAEEGRALGAATEAKPTEVPEPSIVPSEVPAEATTLILAQDEGLQNPTPLRKTVTIFKQKDLQALWNIVYGTEALAPPLPVVDFTKNAVIAVLGGTQTSGGYKLSFAGLEESEDFTNVLIDEKVPGDDCVSAAVMTSPFLLVQVPNTGKTFKTVYNTIATPCQ